MTDMGEAIISEEKKEFNELKYGQLFMVEGCDDGKVWVKTPFADMYGYNNNYTEDGSFCNAVCVNSSRVEYMQCCPHAVCMLINAQKLFGIPEKE